MTRLKIGVHSANRCSVSTFEWPDFRCANCNGDGRFVLAVSGLGMTGPNAMALAMSRQGARAGTASAIMGSMQFGCGLLGGVILNFLVWNALLNMGIMMMLFSGAGVIAIFAVARQLKLQNA